MKQLLPVVASTTVKQLRGSATNFFNIFKVNIYPKNFRSNTIGCATK